MKVSAVAGQAADRHDDVAGRRAASAPARRCSSPTSVVGVAVVPLNVTVLVPCVAPKFVPVIVTDVPTGPLVGDRLVMLGAHGHREGDAVAREAADRHDDVARRRAASAPARRCSSPTSSSASPSSR